MNDTKRYELSLDGELFRSQRGLLLKIADLARRKEPYEPAPGDDRPAGGAVGTDGRDRRPGSRPLRHRMPVGRRQGRFPWRVTHRTCPSEQEDREGASRMDYLPPGRVVKVGDKRFPRWVVKDAENRYWAGEGRWSDEPSGGAPVLPGDRRGEAEEPLLPGRRRGGHVHGDRRGDGTPGAGRRRSLPISWRATGSFSGAGLPARKDS